MRRLNFHLQSIEEYCDVDNMTKEAKKIYDEVYSLIAQAMHNLETEKLDKVDESVMRKIQEKTERLYSLIGKKGENHEVQ